MSTDTKKGPDAPTSDPRKHKATDLTRVTPDPRSHEGPATRRVRALAATGLHPFDVAQAYRDACAGLAPAARLTALRDLAIAVRRERGQRRREAQAAVDAWIGEADTDDLDLDALLSMCAEQLTRWWAPRAGWAPPSLGQHMVVIELGAAS